MGEANFYYFTCLKKFCSEKESLKTAKMKAKGDLIEYSIVGRQFPSDKLRVPPLFRMRIFATDRVVAKSRFWYYLNRLKKVKKAHGEIVSCQKIYEKKPTTVKNFGIWLRYDSRSGTHNMYREYRDLTAAGAVTQCYWEMDIHMRKPNPKMPNPYAVKFFPETWASKPHYWHFYEREEVEESTYDKIAA